ncbi:MAG: redox-regulated ATPase YchF [Pirellulaceae bacterium]|nr:redox-regulated ATPase YchF [Pirellulaceae bacterium]
MKIGIVGYQGCGKSTLFEWLTGERADPAKAYESQTAMAPVPEPRVDALCQIYRPKKVTLAALEIADTPGLSRSHEGSAQKLALIREAGCLVVVVAAFGGNDPAVDLTGLDDDLLLADLDIVSGRIERLRESVKKPRPNREEQLRELAALEPLLTALEGGQAIWQLDLSVEQRRAIRSFQLFSEKPRLVIVNTADDEEHPERFQQLAPPETRLVAASLSLELELSRMTPDERTEFCGELGIQPLDRTPLLRTIMEVSGQMLFFTAGEKEVRTWMIHQGGTAVEAAGNIHTDLARGFIRAETMNCEDLIRLGSEREIKAHNLLRHEHKDYVIQDGDILLIRHN